LSSEREAKKQFMISRMRNADDTALLQFCKNKGLAITGSREILIERIVKNITGG